MTKPCIVFLNERIPAPFFEGGSQISTHIILKELFNMGYPVYSVGVVRSYLNGIVHDYPNQYDQIPIELGKLSVTHVYDKEKKYITYNYPYRVEIYNTLNLEKFYRDVKKRYTQVIFMTQTHYSEEVIPLAIKHQIPTLLFIRDHLQVNTINTIKLLNKPYSNIHIVFNSRFTANQYSALKKIMKTTILYPPVDLDYYKLHSYDPRYITIINPVLYKGGGIFLQLVKRFPQQKFLAVTGWYKPEKDGLNFSGYPNLTVWERKQDIKDVFKLTKILLIPSQWKEAFGRVGVEALVAGIPVIASHQGGLLESLDSACFYVDKYTSEHEWCQVLARLLSDPKKMGMYKKRGIEHSKKFSVNATTENIVKLLETIPNLDTPV